MDAEGRQAPDPGMTGSKHDCEMIFDTKTKSAGAADGCDQKGFFYSFNA
jgi:hypothetical protein